ncbi:exopolysaccharide biosynthesis protein [Alteromonas sp. A079]|uniref:exopolysaccharide biosynthesis protein n=1 Tax=Alteromonas sp. A079 TaxID=3410268 RepID=UPI003B9E0532
MEAAVNSMTLCELLGKIKPKASAETCCFGDFWHVMEKRGFGPMLALPAFVASTPLGAIPGVPSVTGVIILLIALQILLGRRHPWLPSRLMNVEIEAHRLKTIVKTLRPHAARIDRFLVPRWFFMRHSAFRSLIALCCAACGMVMIPLELVPFVGLLPACAVLIMAVGMATDDGAVAIIGLAVAILGFMLCWQQLAAQ